MNTPRMPRNFQQFFAIIHRSARDGSPFQSSPFCRGALGAGNGGGQQQKFMALGSGVIIDAVKMS